MKMSFLPPYLYIELLYSRETGARARELARNLSFSGTFAATVAFVRRNIGEFAMQNMLPLMAAIASSALVLAACGHNVEQKAATGAVAGAVVGGPVGAAVGGAAGAVKGEV